MEEYNVLYLDEHNCLYLIGSHLIEECKHVIYNDVTEELLNNYLDERGKPLYIWENDTLRLLTDEEREQWFTDEQTQLDRIEAAVNKSHNDIIDEYTMQLIEEGVIV